MSKNNEKVLELALLESKRDEKRKRLLDLFHQHSLIQQQMKEVEGDLLRLDDQIDELENVIQQDHSFPKISVVVKSESTNSNEVKENGDSFMANIPMLTHPDEHIPDPMTQAHHEEQIICPPPPRWGSFGKLEVSTIKGRPKKASIGMDGTVGDSSMDSTTMPGAISSMEPKIKGTLDDFVLLKSKEIQNGRVLQVVENVTKKTATTDNRDTTRALQQLHGDNLPWSPEINRILTNVFRISKFRENQKEIINSTMSGEDVFVIMRTGGGKSLTYQLPALVEGRGPQRKITFVVSPLLSLIQDQEDQMNDVIPGSAVSFTSGIKGGATEHARRWSLVRNPNEGVCLVFVTPEKVVKSNKLCGEMERLFAQGRLGRFVIDECHCACQWGHDFRPDYAHLGKLKAHFPSIPILAVTATASDQVREDVCRILRIDSNYRLFKSSSNRPNLTYSVVPKPEGKGAASQAMSQFIKQKYPNGAGIVYTLSRKDADLVASELCDLGILASSYHSDISPTEKDRIHRSWMRNETKVVVATIAFGLGINKPDVRFVLHHSISKTLEAYYQESGRAGRDGLSPTDCVLFYSPKDVTRMLKMVHGSSSEELLWPMVRYGQQSGNDSVCRAIILKHLGEPDCPDPLEVCRLNDGVTTERREVGIHAKTVVELLKTRLDEMQDLTPAMLVKEWRSKGEQALPCLKQNPPAKAGLSADDCERIIVALILEGIIVINAQWTAYDTIIYLGIGHSGERLLRSTEPRILVDLPKRVLDSSPTSVPKNAKDPSLRRSQQQSGQWLSAKQKVVKRKNSAPKKGKIAKKPKKALTASRTKAEGSRISRQTHVEKSKHNDVIDLMSDEDI